jgi:putative phosphoesterase
MNILLLSDTHGYIDDQIIRHASECQEIWHAGDFGTEEVADRLEAIAPLKGVYGNVDNYKLRIRFPLINVFETGGLKVMMTHIGGYPGRYASGIKSKIKEVNPDLFISGHSHLAKVMRDKTLNNLLHINPGAAGIEGMHRIRTLARLVIDSGKITSLSIVELGSRSSI